MEWALAVKHIKKYLDSHQLDIQTGFTTRNNKLSKDIYEHKIYLSTGSLLFLLGYTNTKKCKRCDHPEEDVNHLLLECPKVEEFQQNIYTKIHKIFSKSEERLGGEDGAYAFILLHMNRYIYQQKFLKSPLNPHKFYAMLKIEKKVEEIASKHKKLSKHLSKWSKIIETGIIDW